MWKGKPGVLCARLQYLMPEHRDDKDSMPAFRASKHSRGREGGRRERCQSPQPTWNVLPIGKKC